MFGSGWKPYQNLEYTKYWSNFPTKRCRSLFFSTTPNDGYVQHEKSVSPTSHQNVFRSFWLKLHRNSGSLPKKLLKVPPFQPRNSGKKTHNFFPLRLGVFPWVSNSSFVDEQTVFHQKNTDAWCFFVRIPMCWSQVERQRLEESNLSLDSSRGLTFWGSFFASEKDACFFPTRVGNAL